MIHTLNLKCNLKKYIKKNWNSKNRAYCLVYLSEVELSLNSNAKDLYHCNSGYGSHQFIHVAFVGFALLCNCGRYSFLAIRMCHELYTAWSGVCVHVPSLTLVYKYKRAFHSFYFKYKYKCYLCGIVRW